MAIYQPASPEADLSLLVRSTGALAHRGPDDYGYGAAGATGIVTWKDAPPEAVPAADVLMGHRRLSILDLSEAGRQPFVSADGELAIVYNGEVFNYRELRAELEALGHQFRTRTDTEVALAAYAQWGTECFRRFNGMWAIVIWDGRERRLVACRDRFGVKPLYFQQIGTSWVFASEVKAILEHADAARQVNREALVTYLLDLGNPRDGETFFGGVQAVVPGTCVVLSGGSCDVQRYWRVPERADGGFSGIGEAAERLRELLADAVALRMRSDVRIGTMLSGGLDSTSVISMVRRLMDAHSVDAEITGDILQAFTAIYRGSDIDEEPLVDELCRALKVRANKVFPAQEGEIEQLLHTAAWHMERPYFNSVPIVHTLLMRKARSLGVKVVLNGHGPDEMFAGYPAKYIPAAIGDSIAGLRWREALREITAMRDTYGLGRRRALERALETLVPAAIRRRRLLKTAASSPLLRGASMPLLRPPGDATGRGEPRGRLDRLLLEDFFNESLPNWLHLEDRISMSESIEARLPFLDYRIVEFAFQLPNRFKIDGGVTKRVLRVAMAGVLPDSIVRNLRKVPFSGPDAGWARGPLRRWIESTFLEGDARVFEYVEPTAARRMLADFLNAPAPAVHPYRVWKLINSEVWLTQFFR